MLTCNSEWSTLASNVPLQHLGASGHDLWLELSINIRLSSGEMPVHVLQGVTVLMN